MTLFDLEADVMEIVWSHGWDWFAVSDVHAELEHKRTIAYTTVMTTVNRLFDKSLLRRKRDGRRYLYQPKLGRSELAETVVRRVLERLDRVGEQAVLSLLVERVAHADADELDRLETLIRQKRKELDR